MIYRLKKAIVIGLLVVITLWPAAHHVIVRRYGLNPWKWFGWSMYTVPPKQLQVRPLSGATGRQLPFNALSAEQQRDLMASYNAFGDRHNELGRWVRPDEFARALFDCYPDEDHIDLVVQRFGLDRETAMYQRVEEYTFTYLRDEMLE